MDARLPVLAALLGGVLAAPAALAAPTSCRLLQDPRGDGRNTGYTSTPADGVYNSTDLDLRSADVATDAKNVTAVIRPETLRAADPDSPTGKAYDLSFVAGEQRYVMTAVVAPDGTGGMVYKIDGQDYGDSTAGARPGGPGIGRAKVVWDYAHREVRITAPLSVFAPYAALWKGRVLRGIEAGTYHQYGTGGSRIELPADLVVDYGSGGVSGGVDTASSKKTYTVGARSCVPVGR